MRAAVGLALTVVGLAQTGAAAHTLDEYVQAARLALTRHEVTLSIDLTPGVQVAAPIVAMIDRDHDAVITPAEAAAYGTRVLAETAVALNGEPVAMWLTRIEVPPVGEMRDGMGTIHLSASGAHEVRLIDHAQLSFRNDHAPDISVYAANALLPADSAFSVSRQNRDVAQRSVTVLYDIRPGLAWQMGWVGVGVAGGLLCFLFRNRRRAEVGSERK